MKTIIVLLLFTLQLCYLPLQAQLQLDVKEVNMGEKNVYINRLLDTIDNDYIVRIGSVTANNTSRSTLLRINRKGEVIHEFDIVLEGENLDGQDVTLVRRNGDSIFIAGTLHKPGEMVLFKRPFLAAFSVSTGKLLKLYILTEEEYLSTILDRYSFFHEVFHLSYDARKILYLGVRHFRNEKKFRLRGLYHSALDNSVVDSMIDAPLDIPEGFEVKDNSFGYGLVRNKNIVVSLEIWQESKTGIIVFCLDSVGNKLWDKIIMPKEGYRSASLYNFRNIQVLEDSLICVYQDIDDSSFGDQRQYFITLLSAEGDILWEQNTPWLSRYQQYIRSFRYSPEQKEIYGLCRFSLFPNAPVQLPKLLYSIFSINAQTGKFTYNEVDDGTFQDIRFLYDIYQVSATEYHLFGEKQWSLIPRKPVFGILQRKTTSVVEIAERDKLGVYPNPGSDYITLQADEDTEFSSYIVTDVVGRVVQNATIMQRDNAISVKLLPVGTYILTATTTSGKRHSQVFIISR